MNNHDNIATASEAVKQALDAIKVATQTLEVVARVLQNETRENCPECGSERYLREEVPVSGDPSGNPYRTFYMVEHAQCYDCGYPLRQGPTDEEQADE